MLSLVRWEPVGDPRYPCIIKFWVRVMGVPLHFWADETFRSIGSDLGKVEEVDLDNGWVQVLFDGFKPLVFEASVEFHSGEETSVSLRYERLYGYCRRCSSLCHDVSRCPLFGNNRKQPMGGGSDPRPEDKLQSYKGAAANGVNPGDGSGLRGDRSGVPHQGSGAGNGRGAGGSQAVNHRHKQGFGYKSKKGRRDSHPKEQLVQQVSSPADVGTSLQVAGSGVGPNKEHGGEVGIHLSDTEQTMLDAFLGSTTEESVAPVAQPKVPVAPPLVAESSSLPSEAKRVCKNLFPGSEAPNVTAPGSMELVQQEVLFSDALSELLDQDYPLPDNRTLGFMAPILEEPGIDSEMSSEVDSFLAEEEVTFVNKESSDGDSPGQDFQGEAGAVVAEGDT
ncbi:PREDICTED: uncharacterized protein LOC104740649 [Camelina sativa]|uniref:Uncharacterized protein LOC104740649 n=1 Tax=Camelina sativa TaxID=90675 RepID=A0ABM0VQE1_CAMSA|nr:PREDICTED: uncharacterized protein LOC104740649 [Camelina sativa]